VKRMIDQHRDGVDHSQPLWAMVNLELWFLSCVDSAPSSAAQVPALT
jgi:hypothetical protein